jgi:hypothetical protein
MTQSLLTEGAEKALDLFRSCFIGYLDAVYIGPWELDESLANFLTSEGVSRWPDICVEKYHVTSTLIDSLVRRFVVLVQQVHDQLLGL